jgi:hypothetical protein
MIDYSEEAEEEALCTHKFYCWRDRDIFLQIACADEPVVTVNAESSIGERVPAIGTSPR